MSAMGSEYFFRPEAVNREKEGRQQGFVREANDQEAR
jgi:hypothetical protein